MINHFCSKLVLFLILSWNSWYCSLWQLLLVLLRESNLISSAMSYRQTAVRWPSAFYYPGWTNHFSLLIFAHHPPASRQSRRPSGGHRPVCQYPLPQGPTWDAVSQPPFDRCQAEGPIGPCHQQATHLPRQPSCRSPPRIHTQAAAGLEPRSFFCTASCSLCNLMVEAVFPPPHSLPLQSTLPSSGYWHTA